MSRIIIAVLAALLLMPFAAGKASAADLTQICGNSDCIHADSGGPKVINEEPDGGSWTDFQVRTVSGICDSGDTTTANCPYAGVPAGHVMFEMVYEGSGSWNGKCAGDYGNSPDDTAMSLDPCGGYAGAGAGWGTIFWGNASVCTGGQSEYLSDHWRVGLATGGYGSQWYAGGSDCLKQSLQSITT